MRQGLPQSVAVRPDLAAPFEREQEGLGRVVERDHRPRRYRAGSGKAAAKRSQVRARAAVGDGRDVAATTILEVNADAATSAGSGRSRPSSRRCAGAVTSSGARRSPAVAEGPGREDDAVDVAAAGRVRAVGPAARPLESIVPPSEQNSAVKASALDHPPAVSSTTAPPGASRGRGRRTRPARRPRSFRRPRSGRRWAPGRAASAPAGATPRRTRRRGSAARPPARSGRRRRRRGRPPRPRARPRRAGGSRRSALYSRTSVHPDTSSTGRPPACRPAPGSEAPRPRTWRRRTPSEAPCSPRALPREAGPRHGRMPPASPTRRGEPGKGQRRRSALLGRRPQAARPKSHLGWPPTQLDGLHHAPGRRVDADEGAVDPVATHTASSRAAAAVGPAPDLDVAVTSRVRGPASPRRRPGAPPPTRSRPRRNQRPMANGSLSAPSTGPPSGRAARSAGPRRRREARPLPRRRRCRTGMPKVAGGARLRKRERLGLRDAQAARPLVESWVYGQPLLHRPSPAPEVGLHAISSIRPPGSGWRRRSGTLPSVDWARRPRRRSAVAEGDIPRIAHRDDTRRRGTSPRDPLELPALVGADPDVARTRRDQVPRRARIVAGCDVPRARVDALSRAGRLSAGLSVRVSRRRPGAGDHARATHATTIERRGRGARSSPSAFLAASTTRRRSLGGRRAPSPSPWRAPRRAPPAASAERLWLAAGGGSSRCANRVATADGRGNGEPRRSAPS